MSVDLGEMSQSSADFVPSMIEKKVKLDISLVSSLMTSLLVRSKVQTRRLDNMDRSNIISIEFSTLIPAKKTFIMNR